MDKLSEAKALGREGTIDALIAHDPKYPRAVLEKRTDHDLYGTYAWTFANG